MDSTTDFVFKVYYDVNGRFSAGEWYKKEKTKSGDLFIVHYDEIFSKEQAYNQPYMPPFI